MIEMGRRGMRATMRREPVTTTLAIASAVGGGFMAAKSQSQMRRSMAEQSRVQTEQLATAQAAQAEQKVAIDKAAADNAAVDAGQRAAAGSGGSAGLLAYIDDAERERIRAGLRSKLGGA